MTIYKLPSILHHLQEKGYMIVGHGSSLCMQHCVCVLQLIIVWLGEQAFAYHSQPDPRTVPQGVQGHLLDVAKQKVVG
jgi:hypothetical protein